MATDATGTPTSLGIPKFNTAVDSPSGLGSNAQMDAIDALLLDRATDAELTAGLATKAPLPPASSGVKVWNNGTQAWDAVSGTPDGTKFLRDDGSWQSVTATPPTVGVELYYGERTTDYALTGSIATVMDSGTLTYVAAPYIFEFYAPALDGAVNMAHNVQVWLTEGATQLGCIVDLGFPGWGSGNITPRFGGLYGMRRFTPTAGSHNYLIRAAQPTGSGATLRGGAASTSYAPMSFRITRAT